MQHKVTLARRLRLLREKSGESQQAIADLLGISRQAYANYESESELRRTSPDPDSINKLADHYKVTTDYLLGRTEESSSAIPAKAQKSGAVVYRTTHTEEDIPIVSEIHAGLPTLIFEEMSERLSLPAELLPPGEKFLVHVKGDSMEGARIFDGDLALFVKQDSVEDNEIAAVLIIDTNEVVVKRVHWFDGWVALLPENDPHTPKEVQYMPTTYRADAVKILGKFKIAMREDITRH